ncbi:MAG: methylated-DNA--[protein]-cysteine S-methyltransferase [Candidatus Eremiobacteraeota bacterium]|nr:methylated-DNA--[protein]-cysteine S-methyltransferase [Candidatus Eremiobacteraeota bacterium]
MDARLLQACRYIEEADRPPTLAHLGRLIGLSEAHLQRQFKRQIGVSPRNYSEMVRQRRLRLQLQQQGGSVTTAIYDAGFASSSQVYEKTSSMLGMTPAKFREGGKNAELLYAIIETQLGKVLVAVTQRGVCRVDIGSELDLQLRLRAEFPLARITRADDELESTTSLIVGYISGSEVWPRLPIDVRGTAFQRSVWTALLELKPGTTKTYAQLAQAIGCPKAVRAIARACAANPVALLIPCHRFVPAGGGVGGYRWDPKRKEKLLAMEHALRSAEVATR